MGVTCSSSQLGQEDEFITGQTFRILCYGENLAPGRFDEASGSAWKPYGATLSQCLSSLGLKCKVSDCGLPDYTVRQMIAMLDDPQVRDSGGRPKGLVPLVQECGPYDLVIIMAGANDLRDGENAEAIFLEVQRLHAACHRMQIPTVVVAPPALPNHNAVPAASKERLRRMLAEWVQETSSVLAFADLDELLPPARKDPWEYRGVDGRLSSAGARAIGMSLITRLLPVLSHLGIEGAPRATVQWALMQQRAPHRDDVKRDRVAAVGGA
jgi:hypothetical protein